MSTITHETTGTPNVPAEHVHTHPSDLQYVKIAAILAVAHRPRGVDLLLALDLRLEPEHDRRGARSSSR